jgi:hypothetical protein
MISIAVVALLFILLIVFCVISAKSWHWSNIVFLILAYIAGVAACIGLSKVLDGRSKALKAVSTSEKRLNTLIDQLEMVTSGPADSLSYSPDSLRGRTAALQLQLHGQGRVWSGLVNANGNTRVFNFDQARDVGEGNPVVLKDVVLYAFLNEAVDATGTTYPKSFIGTVRVINETPAAWNLEPAFMVRQDLYDAGDGAEWSLYEKMPADRHDTFSNIAKIDVEADDFDITAYRTRLETDFLPAALMGFEVDNGDPELARAAAIAYERFIDRIAFDGLSLGTIESWIDNAERISGDFSPAPEEVFVKYQFEKKSGNDKPFLVDAEGSLEGEGPFTKNGQAIDKSIHNGSEVQFDKDDIVLVDSRNATGYNRPDQTVVPPFDQRYPVKELDRVFVRRLNNFPLMLEKLRIQAKEIAEKTVVVKADIQIAQKTLDNALLQQDERDIVIGKLREDNDNLTQDVQVIAELLKNRQSEVESLREKILEVEAEIRRRRGIQ